MYLRSWVQPVINPLQNFRGGGTVMCETCIAARIRRQRRDSSSTTCCKPCSFSRTQSCTSSCPGDHEVVLEFCRVRLEDFCPYTQGWLIRLGLLLISQSLCNLTRAICKLSANLAIPLSYNLWLQPLFGYPAVWHASG
jgi:hypothetical protein